VDGGDRWVKLTGGVPNIPFRDLGIQRRENDLVGATFGRGFFVFDDYTPLRSVTEDLLEQEAELFPVRAARWYIQRRTLGRSDKASQGSAFFTAPNPPFGAVFTYYLRDSIQTRQKARREREKEIEKEGGDTPYPGWTELRKEELEEDPAIVLTVRDAAGNVVRRLTGPVSEGFHRVAWDLRHPSTAAWSPGDDGDRSGFLAAPGTYTVALAKRVDGASSDLGETRSFEVVPMRTGTLPGASPDEVAAFLRQVAELQRAVQGARAAIDDTSRRLTGIQAALLRSTVGDTALDDEARALEDRLEGLRETLSGNAKRGMAGDPGPVSIAGRLQVAVMGNRSSTYGPTPTHRDSAAIAERRLAVLRTDLDRLIRVDLPALEEKLDAAGVPWTPGRAVPAEREVP